MRGVAVVFALVAPFALSACAYPTSTIQQGSAPSGIYFSHLPEGARAYVDGGDVGLASAFDGKKALLSVSPGRHQVAVRVAGSSLIDQPIYVGPGSRVEVGGK